MRIFSDNTQRGSLGREGEDELSSISLTLSEPADSDHVWLVRLEAKGGNQGSTREVGRVLTRSPAAGGPHTRVLCLATAPGSNQWLAEVTHVSGTTPAYCEAELTIHGCPQVLGEAFEVLHGFDASVGRRYYSNGGVLAVGPNVVNVPAGVSIHTIMAWLDAPDVGVIAYTDPNTGSLVTVPIPSGSGITLAPRGTLWGPLAIGFTTTAQTGGWAIEGLR